MEATIKDPQTSGVGIAAPQVGVGRKLILVQRFDKKFSNSILYQSRNHCLQPNETRL